MFIIYEINHLNAARNELETVFQSPTNNIIIPVMTFGGLPKTFLTRYRSTDG